MTNHLFPGGMLAECEDTKESIIIPEGNAKALVDFINEVEANTSPNAVYTLTEKGKEDG